MVNTKMFEFKHPKYYKEFTIKRNKSDQAISSESTRRLQVVACVGPGLIRAFHQLQAASIKPQAPSFKRQAQIKNYNRRQAPSSKRQASSHKRQAP
jgi:hypothetical protein